MATEDSTDLITAPDLAKIRRLAGERFFARGEAYFAEGAVRTLRRQGHGVEARVVGTRTYRVRLWWADGELEYDCSCPVGRDGAFCKHCVAVGLVWNAGGADDLSAEAAGGVDEEDLRAYLQGLDRETLASLLLDHAEENERLHRKLMVRAAQAADPPTEISVWKDAFAEALQTDDFVSYHEAFDYARGIEEVIDSLEDMLQRGQADGVIQLAEYGLAEIEEVIGEMDDSDGRMGGLLHRLQELHVEACRAARPDPAELAERLFEQEMESDFDVFHRAAETYADVLGKAGLATYRRLAEADWAKVRPLGPGETDPDRYGRRFRITSIMEAIAGTDGDLDALAAIKSRDLSLPYSFLKTAELYRDAGKPELALEWAERGWQAFPETDQDDRLRAFLADAYHARGRHDDAIGLAWRAFAASPRLETYRQLEKRAKRARQWPTWRKKALARVRESLAHERGPTPTQPAWQRNTSKDRSLLVEIFLHENDVEAAWHEAETGGCSPRLWRVLAERLEKSRPADSIRIYRAHITALLRDTGNGV